MHACAWWGKNLLSQLCLEASEFRMKLLHALLGLVVLLL
jgi:hypothetical protein